MNNDQKEYVELMNRIVEDKVEGKSVTIPLSLLYDIQMFLLASSHMEDMGELPHTTFVALSSDLSYKLYEYSNEFIKFFPKDCYIRYDSLWEKYMNEDFDEIDYE